MGVFVVLLLETGRLGVRQAFGPYDTEPAAEAALADLQAWPALHGVQEIRPLTRHGEAAPAAPDPVPIAPAAPYVPPHTHPAPAWPQPQWPYQPAVIWCDTLAPQSGFVSLDQARVTLCSGVGAQATFVYTVPPGQPTSPRDDEPPDAAVLARV